MARGVCLTNTGSVQIKKHALRLTPCPWDFKGFLMILMNGRGETINEVALSRAQYWVQIPGLPLENVDEENALMFTY